MIKLLKLRFVGIGRFVKEQTIQFQGRDKLIQADGKNNNTGGSSGAGKSTVFHAIDYLLDINDIPATALQSRNSKVGLEVEGWFDVDSVPLRVVRSKKEGLSVYYGEESVTGNVKLAEERLEQIIGIPKKLFKKMIHKKQKEGGFFLKMTSGEQYKFLIKVLGLEHYLEKIDKIDKDIAEIKKANQSVQLNISSIRSSMEDVKNTLSVLTPPAAPQTSDTAIMALKKSAEDRENTIKAMESELNLAVAAIEKEQLEEQGKILPPISLPSTVDTSGIDVLKNDLKILEKQKLDIEIQVRTNISEMRKNLDEITKSINGVTAAKKEFSDITAKITSLQQQKAHIEDNKCPTCTQTWVGDSATAKINSITNETNMSAERAWNLKTKIDTETILHTQDAFIRKQIQDLELDDNTKKIGDKILALKVKISEEQIKIDSYLSNINKENQLKNVEWQNQVLAVRMRFDEKKTTLKSAFADKIYADKTALQEALNFIRQQEAELTNYVSQKKNYDVSSASFLKSIEDKQRSLTEEENKESVNLKKIAIAEESKRLIKNYTLQIFQESLDYIGDKASEILSKVPNMANASIYFEGCKETLKGTIKDEVTAILNMDGENDIPIKTLSGGEETSAELAIDFAVIDMIEFKTGKGADFVILDEPFTGLDSINIQNVMDMLIELDTGKKIIIVDHNPEIKAMVSDKILVVREGEESHIAS